MNTEQLETFLALAETKNFSRCAQRLIISQSAVSKRIFELEKELGQTLFHRSGGVAQTVVQRGREEMILLFPLFFCLQTGFSISDRPNGTVLRWRPDSLRSERVARLRKTPSLTR